MKESLRFKLASYWIGATMYLHDTKEFIREYWKDLVTTAMVVAVASALVLTYELLLKDKPDTSKPVPVEQSSKVSKVDTEVITPKAVKVYKAPAKKKLNLPPQVQEDSTKVVTSAVTVDYSLLRKQTVSSVLNTDTGETITYVNEEPTPWLAGRSFGSASLAYGFKGLNPAPVVRGMVTYDIVQIKVLTFGGVATLDSDGDTFVGVRGTYRW